MHISIEEKIAKLKAGETVLHKGSGNSMRPVLRTGWVQTLAPVTDPSEIREGDAVFCKIRSGSILTHEVIGIRRNGDALEFHIARRWPTRRSNGWVSQENIYGRVVAINGKPYRTKR
jgi:hypothetical protein